MAYQQSCPSYTAQKMKFSIKHFFSKYDQIRSFLRIWSYLLKKFLMENSIFCAVPIVVKPTEINRKKNAKTMHLLLTYRFCAN